MKFNHFEDLVCLSMIVTVLLIIDSLLSFAMIGALYNRDFGAGIGLLLIVIGSSMKIFQMLIHPEWFYRQED